MRMRTQVTRIEQNTVVENNNNNNKGSSMTQVLE